MKLGQLEINVRQFDGEQERLAALPSVSHEFLPLVSRAGEDPMRQSIDARACGK